jgi:hypothetical protein
MVSTYRESLSGVDQEGRTDAVLFLSPEWIEEVVRVVRRGREQDMILRRASAHFSFRVQYEICGLPRELRACHHGRDRATIAIELRRGIPVQVLTNPEQAIEPEISVQCGYEVARGLLAGELSPGASFFNGLLEVKFSRSTPRRPNFLARSVTAAHQALRFARSVPVRFPSPD